MSANQPGENTWASIGARLNEEELGPEEHYERLCELVPNPDDREAYFSWSKARVREQFHEDFVSMGYEKFVSGVEQLSFFSSSRQDKAKYYEWQRGTEKYNVPDIPLGCTKSALYMLRPNVFTLQSKTQEEFDNKPLVKDFCFLGVNTNVQPRLPMTKQERRNANLSEQSTESAQSDDLVNGFMFHQLGELLTCSIKYKDNLDNVTWHPTGFSVVVRLTNSGRADSIYLIFNTYPELEEGGRYEVTEEDWGYLPFELASEPQMSYARLKPLPSAPLLRNRDFNTPFETDFDQSDDKEASRWPVELVRLKSHGNSALRYTVAPGTGQPHSAY